MLFLSRCSLLLFASCLTSSQADISKNVNAVVERLWSYVAEGRLLVTSPNIDIFLSRYERRSTGMLNLIECDFKTGLSSWVKDFEDLGVTLETAAAYFKTLDVKGTGIMSRLSIEDVDELVDICERHLHRCQHDCRGFLGEEEFKKGFNEVVFRALPFTLLFVRASRTPLETIGCEFADSTLRFIPVRRHSWHRFHGDHQRARRLPDKAEFQYERLPINQWRRLFFDIANTDSEDGELKSVITKARLGHFWSAGKYGPWDKGEALFKVLVEEGAEAIYYDTWQEIFTELDCRNRDNYLDIMEFLQLDQLVNGDKRRHDGKCLLRRN